MSPNPDNAAVAQGKNSLAVWVGREHVSPLSITVTPIDRLRVRVISYKRKRVSCVRVMLPCDPTVLKKMLG